MKRIGWLFSLVLMFAISWQATQVHAPLHAQKQSDTKQFTTKQEVAGTNAVKGSFQLQQSLPLTQTTTFSPYALLLGSRLVDVFFTHQTQSFTQLKSILFSPTFLLLRVLRL